MAHELTPNDLDELQVIANCTLILPNIRKSITALLAVAEENAKLRAEVDRVSKRCDDTVTSWGQVEDRLRQRIADLESRLEAAHRQPGAWVNPVYDDSLRSMVRSRVPDPPEHSARLSELVEQWRAAIANGSEPMPLLNGKPITESPL